MTESPRWFKSSYSSNGGACVEIATNLTARGVVPVRDSKNPTGPALAIDTAAWADFVAFVRTTEI
ncbi:DUF397 domain-containing protein [Streptomyces varsoviensis]|uniref:DUF397 domain-containing protein n=1 Tax=Streptomyces varsoviensis TaxID=67373 RepID=A0ABR5JC42_9ACTN|nr:DUF397 domain-containing protein [Streptomyces varsoviensis]KOG90868.1 hypothetical protein ADK38_06320 [Streptomyces varsoviensis]